MVKLRLRRMGTVDKPFYRIVAVDSRKKRDGKYLECVGYYDPKTDPLTLKVDADRALHWLGVGAQPSETVRSLLRKAGLLEKWHNKDDQTAPVEEEADIVDEVVEEGNSEEEADTELEGEEEE